MLDGVRMVATWRIRLNDPCATAMRAVAKITVITRYYSKNLKELHTSDIEDKTGMLSKSEQMDQTVS